jgi:hypothetical protein
MVCRLTKSKIKRTFLASVQKGFFLMKGRRGKRKDRRGKIEDER